MAGILGLYMEFSHPGVIFPGGRRHLSRFSLDLLAAAYFQSRRARLDPFGSRAFGRRGFHAEFRDTGDWRRDFACPRVLLLFDTQDSTIGVDPSIIFTAVATMASFVLAISYLVYRSQKAKPSRN